MNKVKAALVLTALGSMNLDNQFRGYLNNPLGLRPDKDPEPKNKYNLNDEQIEQMSEMSPKEKKQFLKKAKAVK